MIDIGDKVKVVDCDLCGKHCNMHIKTFNVVFPSSMCVDIQTESMHKSHIQSLDGYSQGRVCKTRLRKIYD